MRNTRSAIQTSVAAVTAILLAFSALPLAAQDAPRELTAEEMNFYQNEVSLSLAPDSTHTGAIRSVMTDLDPRVGIEIALPIAVTDDAFTAEGLATVYSILQSISTMEGLEYYSASRGEMRTFYHESYVIAGANDRTRVPDPRVERIPPSSTLYAYQRDGSFGRNVQRIDYTYTNGEFLLVMENETTMTYRVVPLVTPGNLRTAIIVQPDPAAGIFRFYGNLGVRVPALFGLEDRARNSFYNRIVALHAWFVAELERANLVR